MVLRGFRFWFYPELEFGTKRDFHLREIGVWTPANRIEVYYGGGNRFDWTVQWATLQETPVIAPGIFRAHCVAEGRARRDGFSWKSAGWPRA